jgi:hypothetical protein
MWLKWSKVELLKPSTYQNGALPIVQLVYVVETKEVSKS